MGTRRYVCLSFFTLQKDPFQTRKTLLVGHIVGCAIRMANPLALPLIFLGRVIQWFAGVSGSLGSSKRLSVHSKSRGKVSCLSYMMQIPRGSLVATLDYPLHVAWFKWCTRLLLLAGGSRRRTAGVEQPGSLPDAGKHHFPGPSCWRVRGRRGRGGARPVSHLSSTHALCHMPASMRLGLTADS